MKAKKKPIDEKNPDDYGVDPSPRLEVMKNKEQGGRKEGVEVKTVSELVGVSLKGGGGWRYSEVYGPAGLLETYRQMIQALMDPGPVEGFCYTQLTDVMQERNGLLTFDRIPKIDPDLVRSVTQTPKRR
jgi:hypothetical protein